MDGLIRLRNAELLRRVVWDAACFVPFYQQHWRDADIDMRRFDVHRDFHRLPIVRKSDLLNYASTDWIDLRRRGHHAMTKSTSGSTGRPLTLRIDRRAHRRRRSRFLRALLAAGYRPGQRLMLISNPPHPCGTKWARWTYVNAREGEAAVLAAYERVRPHVLYGPLSSLLLLARRVLECREAPRPRLVISTAERLRAAHRQLLTQAFACGIADFYGTKELGLIAYRAEPQRTYRAFNSHFHLEFLAAAGAGQYESLVATDLGGGVMPLIRFDTGDLVRRDHTRPDAPIVQLSGREVDCLRRADGGWVCPCEVTLALDPVPGIRQYQVVQRRDRIVDLYVVPAGVNVSAELQEARRALQRVCGESMLIEVHARDVQPLKAGHKERIVCSQAVR